MSSTALSGTLPVASPYPFPSGVQVAVGTTGGRRHRRRTHRKGGADPAPEVAVAVSVPEEKEETGGRRRKHRKSHRKGGAEPTTAGRRRRHTKKHGGRKHRRSYKLF